MNENSDIVDVPARAEAKVPQRPSHQVLALKKEVMDFAGSQTQALLLEKMRVEAKLAAYTQIEPDQLLQRFEDWKIQQVQESIDRGRPIIYDNLSSPLHEKRFLSSIQAGGLPGDKRYTILNSREDIREAHYLFRMYRSLSNISW